MEATVFKFMRGHSNQFLKKEAADSPETVIPINKIMLCNIEGEELKNTHNTYLYVRNPLLILYDI
jgi:hypothetical protein